MERDKNETIMEDKHVIVKKDGQVVIKDYEEIKYMSDGELLTKFEDLVRKGAGPEYLLVSWMRKEILKRLEKFERLKNELELLSRRY